MPPKLVIRLPSISRREDAGRPGPVAEMLPHEVTVTASKSLTALMPSENWPVVVMLPIEVIVTAPFEKASMPRELGPQRQYYRPT